MKKKTEIYYKKLFDEVKKIKDLKTETHNLKYKNGKFKFVRIFPKKINKKDRIFFISAGIHGNEVSGPITILKHLQRIYDYAKKSGLKLIIYPLLNPSGFEINYRYNIDRDKGVFGNNDFIRYELEGGRIVDDLRDKNEFKKWYWSSDKRFNIRLPEEVKLAHGLLKKEPLKQVVAALDLHQDYITSTRVTATYAYAFGNLKKYAKIVDKLRKTIPVFENKLIGAGYSVSNPEDYLRSDKNGIINRHDGSITDLLYRLGAKHSITVETTGRTPIEVACMVNLVWITGVMDLITKK